MLSVPKNTGENKICKLKKIKKTEKNPKSFFGDLYLQIPTIAVVLSSFKVCLVILYFNCVRTADDHSTKFEF